MESRRRLQRDNTLATKTPPSERRPDHRHVRQWKCDAVDPPLRRQPLPQSRRFPPEKSAELEWLAAQMRLSSSAIAAVVVVVVVVAVVGCKMAGWTAAAAWR